MPAGQRRRSAGRALRLDVVVQQLEAFRGEPVDPRCPRATQHTTAVAAELAPAEVVPEEVDDVRLLRLLSVRLLCTHCCAPSLVLVGASRVGPGAGESVPVHIVLVEALCESSRSRLVELVTRTSRIFTPRSRMRSSTPCSAAWSGRQARSRVRVSRRTLSNSNSSNAARIVGPASPRIVISTASTIEVLDRAVMAFFLELTVCVLGQHRQRHVIEPALVFRAPYRLFTRNRLRHESCTWRRRAR